MSVFTKDKIQKNKKGKGQTYKHNTKGDTKDVCHMEGSFHVTTIAFLSRNLTWKEKSYIQNDESIKEHTSPNAIHNYFL